MNETLIGDSISDFVIIGSWKNWIELSTINVMNRYFKLQINEKTLTTVLSPATYHLNIPIINLTSN